MGSRGQPHRDIDPSTRLTGNEPPSTADVEDGWSGVERALAYVDQMVGGLSELTVRTGTCLPVVAGDVTDWDEVFRLDGQLMSTCPSSSSHQLTDDRSDDVDHDDGDVTAAVDYDARRCINDACDLL